MIIRYTESLDFKIYLMFCNCIVTFADEGDCTVAGKADLF